MFQSRVENAFYFTVLLLVVVLAGYIFWPSVTALVLALTFASAFRPVYKFLKTFLRWEGLTSIVTVFLVFIVVFLPLGYFAREILNQATALYVNIAQGQADPGDFIKHISQTKIGQLLPSVTGSELDKYVSESLSWLVGQFGNIFQQVTNIIFTIFISLIALYYFLKDGERFREQVIKALPINQDYAEEVFSHTARAIKSVVLGALAVAVIQGILSGLGFMIFGVPRPALWAAVTIVAALVPTLGTSLVMIPVIAYLLLSGATMPALGMAIWAAIAVGLIDNLLGPQLMRYGTKMHPLLILLSVIGGIAVFGVIGFLVGPIVLALLSALLDIYPKILRSEAKVLNDLA
ncbi:MAG TPA: AI-2E family transporter [Candidatus Paceibacterota bacterium]